MVGLCQTTSCRGVLLLLRRFRGSLNGQPVNACRAAAFSLQHREWDEIGAPDPTSNIRPLRFKSLPQDVMGLELQRLQKRVWELNHNFWKRHNTEFQEVGALSSVAVCAPCSPHCHWNVNYEAEIYAILLPLRFPLSVFRGLYNFSEAF